MTFGNVSILALVVTAVAYFAVGMLWYSPALFAKQWMKMAGISEKAMKKAKKSMGSMMVLAFVANLVLVYVFGNLLYMLGATTALTGAKMAFFIWVGFFATTQLGSFLWEQKPFKLYLLNTCYMLVSLVVMGLILGAFSAYGY